MSKQKFRVGNIVKISEKFKDRYNQIKSNGTIISVSSVYDFTDHNNRKIYEVKFEDKDFVKPFYSYELDLVSDTWFAPIYMPLENVQCINNMTEKQIRDLDPEYYDFMEQYHKEHACCPKCGSKHHSSTLVGYLFNSQHPEKYKDMNSVTCIDCGWKGVVHQMVPEKH